MSTSQQSTAKRPEATAGAGEDQTVAMSQEGAGRDVLLQTQRWAWALFPQRT